MSNRTVGTSSERFGGADRVTGHQRYLADIKVEGALHVKLVTLDCARARIVSIDTSEAERIPGVAFVMTGDDLPQPIPRYGYGRRDRPVLADGETKFHGEPVAAVAAETREAAEEAALLVRVGHEVLPAVFTIEQALDPSSPLVQDPSIRPGDLLAGTNKLCEYEFGWGDLDGVEADIVVDETYSWPMQTHFAIEPHAFTAAPEGGGGIVVWSTIQHPFQLQKTLAQVLGLPLSKVRVFAPDLGGAFGGKQHAKYEPLVAFMALRAGRPVRLVLSLEEACQGVRRVSADTRLRTGFRRDGTLVFQDFEINWLAGAYADSAARAASKGGWFAAGPYRSPSVRIVSRALFSHTATTHPQRGFGIPQLSWAREMNIDAGARALGMDPVELRLLNLVKYQEECIPGDTPADGDWEQTLRKAADEIGWDEQRPLGRGVGRGIAIGLKSGPTTGLSYARVRLLADGSAVLYCGTSDMGQGARTVFAQIVGQELGLPLERVSVVMGDTQSVPYDQQTSASRSTVLMGTAVLRACRDLQEQVGDMAASLFGIGRLAITVEDGEVRLPDKRLPLTEIMQTGLGRLGGELVGMGEMRTAVDPEHPLGGPPVFYMFNATAVEVRVDEGTGEVDVLKHVTVSDVGYSLNPRQVTGQDDGAAVMGLGHALMEHMILDDEGRTRNLGAIDYRIPTILDLPREYHSFQIENRDGPGPYGSKGMSEGSLLVTAPAFASAITDATGAVIRDLPMSPERVWRALQEPHDPA